MDDMVLKAKIDDVTTVYVTLLDPQIFAEYLDEDTLGGSEGYFVTRTLNTGHSQRFEILAKAPSFQAAENIFDMIVSASSKRQLSNDDPVQWY
jgi:hypothetical protein